MWIPILSSSVCFKMLFPSKVTGARMFLMASPSLQLAHFFVGLFVFISGLGLSYWGTKKAPGKNYSVKFA